MEAVVGFLIRRERLRREWSQAGLCRGICAVSYLSKIEQGKVSASEEVLRRLAQRLELPWYGGTAALAEAGAQIERLYEALLYLDQPALEREKPLFAADMERLAFSPYAVDAALLKRALFDDAAALPETEMEPYMDARQLALLRIFQGRFDEAIRLYPHAYCHFCAGADAYASGESYAVALAHLQRGYDLAARDGAAWLMLQCRLLMGNCFCNQLELEHMQAEYGAAARLATALRDISSLRHIAYNTASAQLEAGQYDEAYAYFSRLEQPTAMELHKLAICCEKTGRNGQALAAIDAARHLLDGAAEGPVAETICAVVRFRLEHPDYLQRQEYGRLLLDCFDACRQNLPIGYASFHLPWVVEWYTANRQYKQAFELLKSFPIKINNLCIN